MLKILTDFLDGLGADYVDGMWINGSYDVLSGRGSVSADIMFVGASPSELDMVRKKAFSGDVGAVMKSAYMDPFGLSEENAYLTTLVPVTLYDDRGIAREPTDAEIEEFSHHFMAEVDKVKPGKIIALGKTVKNALGDMADGWLPHPRAVMLFGDSGEVARKMQSFVGTREEEPTADDVIRVTKASDDEKRIVYGVVIAPEEEDTDGNWATAEDIEKTAHVFMEKYQTIGNEHMELLEGAVLVESYINPTTFEVEDQTITKGSWIMAVRVDNEEAWSEVKKGVKSGFSFGGRADIDPSSLIE